MMTPKQSQYDFIAQSYASYDSLPLAKLEHELVTKAIGDCTGLTVLDLGGGNGQYARKAIELGAELVDVVDISPAMLEVGIEIEQELVREGKIRWLEADASKAMHNLPLMPDGYDVVMCNWLFDHAETDDDLETMWQNAATQLKPGGKLVNIRSTEHLDEEYAASGKYGISISDLVPFPGGMQYQVHCHNDPSFQFGAHLLDKHADLSNDINHRNGLGDLEYLKAEDTQVVKEDEAFWADFVKAPFMGVLTARKP
ncbi:hypothetical protein MBLNU13_g02972t1 [Cladosporium sp. NU13]